MFKYALLSLLLVSLPAWTAEKYSCIEQTRHRQFDFWAGNWQVRDQSGKKTYGQNSIVIAEDGCVLQETWTGAGGSSGSSINYFDPRDGLWHQLWVDNGTSIITIAGGMQDGSMVLNGDIYYLVDGRQASFRGSWTPLPDGSVRQLFEEQDAEGKWQPWFDGYYHRRGDPDTP